MTTTADLIADCKRHLLANYREQLNVLAQDYTAGADTLTFTYDLKGLQSGSYVALGLEVFYVLDTNPSAKTATVLGAQLGSSSADHATGDVANIDPKFSDFAIFQAINADLSDLSAPNNGLYRIRTVDLTYNAAVTGYDLTSTTDILKIQEIRYKTPGVEKDWPKAEGRIARNMPTDTFASGNALMLLDGGSPGLQVRVSYRAPFAALTALTDNVATTGLPTTAYDLPPIGAAIRLMAGREVKRTFIEAQGEPRRASEVPPGATTASSQALRALRAQRIAAEASRLTQQWGP